MQNKGLKVALHKNRFYITTPLHQEAGTASWESRALILLNRLMIKFIFKEDFLQDNLFSTRQSNGTLYKLDEPNLSAYRSLVSYISRKSWNELPSYLRMTKDFECFKTLLKGHYDSKQLVK